MMQDEDELSVISGTTNDGSVSDLNSEFDNLHSQLPFLGDERALSPQITSQDFSVSDYCQQRYGLRKKSPCLYWPERFTRSPKPKKKDNKIVTMIQTFKDFFPTVKDLSPTFEDLSPILKELSPTLKELSPFMEDLSPTMKDLTPTMKDLTPTLEDLSPTLEELFPLKMHTQEDQGFTGFSCSGGNKVTSQGSQSLFGNSSVIGEANTSSCQKLDNGECSPTANVALLATLVPGTNCLIEQEPTTLVPGEICSHQQEPTTLVPGEICSLQQELTTLVPGTICSHQQEFTTLVPGTIYSHQQELTILIPGTLCSDQQLPYAVSNPKTDRLPLSIPSVFSTNSKLKYYPSSFYKKTEASPEVIVCDRSSIASCSTIPPRESPENIVLEEHTTPHKITTSPSILGIGKEMNYCWTTDEATEPKPADPLTSSQESDASYLMLNISTAAKSRRKNKNFRDSSNCNRTQNKITTYDSPIITSELLQDKEVNEDVPILNWSSVSSNLPQFLACQETNVAKYQETNLANYQETNLANYQETNLANYDSSKDEKDTTETSSKEEAKRTIKENPGVPLLKEFVVSSLMPAILPCQSASNITNDEKDTTETAPNKEVQCMFQQSTDVPLLKETRMSSYLPTLLSCPTANIINKDKTDTTHTKEAKRMTKENPGVPLLQTSIGPSYLPTMLPYQPANNTNKDKKDKTDTTHTKEGKRMTEENPGVPLLKEFVWPSNIPTKLPYQPANNTNKDKTQTVPNKEAQSIVQQTTDLPLLKQSLEPSYTPTMLLCSPANITNKDKIHKAKTVHEVKRLAKESLDTSLSKKLVMPSYIPTLQHQTTSNNNAAKMDTPVTGSNIKDNGRINQDLDLTVLPSIENQRTTVLPSSENQRTTVLPSSENQRTNNEFLDVLQQPDSNNDRVDDSVAPCRILEPIQEHRKPYTACLLDDGRTGKADNLQHLGNCQAQKNPKCGQISGDKTNLPAVSMTELSQNGFLNGKNTLEGSSDSKTQNKDSHSLSRLLDLYDKMLEKLDSGCVSDGQSHLDRFEQIIKKLATQLQKGRTSLLSVRDQGKRRRKKLKEVNESEDVLKRALKKHELLKQRVLALQTNSNKQNLDETSLHRLKPNYNTSLTEFQQSNSSIVDATHPSTGQIEFTVQDVKDDQNKALTMEQGFNYVHGEDGNKVSDSRAEMYVGPHRVNENVHGKNSLTRVTSNELGKSLGGCDLGEHSLGGSAVCAQETRSVDDIVRTSSNCAQETRPYAADIVRTTQNCAPETRTCMANVQYENISPEKIKLGFNETCNAGGTISMKQNSVARTTADTLRDMQHTQDGNNRTVPVIIQKNSALTKSDCGGVNRCGGASSHWDRSRKIASDQQNNTNLCNGSLEEQDNNTDYKAEDKSTTPQYKDGSFEGNRLLCKLDNCSAGNLDNSAIGNLDNNRTGNNRFDNLDNSLGVLLKELPLAPNYARLIQDNKKILDANIHCTVVDNQGSAEKCQMLQKVSALPPQTAVYVDATPVKLTRTAEEPDQSRTISWQGQSLPHPVSDKSCLKSLPSVENPASQNTKYFFNQTDSDTKKSKNRCQIELSDSCSEKVQIIEGKSSPNNTSFNSHSLTHLSTCQSLSLFVNNKSNTMKNVDLNSLENLPQDNIHNLISTNVIRIDEKVADNENKSHNQTLRQDAPLTTQNLNPEFVFFNQETAGKVKIITEELQNQNTNPHAISYLPDRKQAQPNITTTTHLLNPQKEAPCKPKLCLGKRPPASPSSTISSSLFAVPSKEIVRRMETRSASDSAKTTPQAPQAKNNLQFSVTQTNISKIFGTQNILMKNLPNQVCESKNLDFGENSKFDPSTGVDITKSSTGTIFNQTDLTQSGNQPKAPVPGTRKKRQPKKTIYTDLVTKKARYSTNVQDKGNTEHNHPSTNASVIQRHEPISENSCIKTVSANTQQISKNSFAVTNLSNIQPASVKSYTSANLDSIQQKSKSNITTTNLDSFQQMSNKTSCTKTKLDNLSKMSKLPETSLTASNKIDGSIVIRNLRYVRMISDVEVADASNEFTPDFWKEDFSKIKMSQAFWNILDVW